HLRKSMTMAYLFVFLLIAAGLLSIELPFPPDVPDRRKPNSAPQCPLFDKTLPCCVPGPGQNCRSTCPNVRTETDAADSAIARLYLHFRRKPAHWRTEGT